jgi:DNA-binding transcriptional regulator LsrR (DeoR family)
MATRGDTIVVLSVAGSHKAELVRAVLAAGLCNTLIPDVDTAAALVDRNRSQLEDFGYHSETR